MYIIKPFFTDYGVLFYRKDLLQKYYQSVPRTWDQLEYITEFILEKESSDGNNDLNGYASQLKGLYIKFY